MKRIRVINSNPAEGQTGLEEYIGMEFDTVETWKTRNTTLEEGQVGVVLRCKSDLNPKGQWSILNKGEYEFI